jgi:hypothetical protein
LEQRESANGKPPSRRVPVLLDDGDSVGFRGVLDGDRGSLHDFVDLSNEVVGDVVNGLVMLLWNDECVPFVEWSYVEECDYFIVFVHDTGRSFFSRYPAENARDSFHFSRRHLRNHSRFWFLAFMQKNMSYWKLEPLLRLSLSRIIVNKTKSATAINTTM